MPKKTEREDPLGFFNIHFVEKLEKLKGCPIRGEFFLKKVAQCRKILKGDPLVSSGIVCYAGNLLASSENFVALLVELFWSVQVVSKNTEEKPRL